MRPSPNWGRSKLRPLTILAAQWGRSKLCHLTILALATLTTSCVTGELRPNPRLIEPYSQELEAKEPFETPFLAHFKKGKKELVYVAAFHENKVGSKTFKLIDQAFRNHKFRMVIIEGFPASRGVAPQNIIEDFEANREGDFYRWGEPSYAALLARDRGIPFVGGEPDEGQIVRAVRKSGFSAKDLAGFYFVRQIPQFVRDGSLRKAHLGQLYNAFMGGVRPLLGLKPRDFSFGEFLVWYETANGKALNLETFDPEETMPLAKGKYRTQRLAYAVGMARDRFMVELTARMLNEHGRVLVVFGKSHLAQQRPALQAMLGRPKSQRAL